MSRTAHGKGQFYLIVGTSRAQIAQRFLKLDECSFPWGMTKFSDTYNPPAKTRAFFLSWTLLFFCFLFSCRALLEVRALLEPSLRIALPRPHRAISVPQPGASHEAPKSDHGALGAPCGAGYVRVLRRMSGRGGGGGAGAWEARAGRFPLRKGAAEVLAAAVSGGVTWSPAPCGRRVRVANKRCVLSYLWPGGLLKRGAKNVLAGLAVCAGSGLSVRCWRPAARWGERHAALGGVPCALSRHRRQREGCESGLRRLCLLTKWELLLGCLREYFHL